MIMSSRNTIQSRKSINSDQIRTLPSSAGPIFNGNQRTGGHGQINQLTNYDYDEEEDDLDDIENNGSDKVKVKIMSIWNNVKYGWTVRLRTSFSYESPIWFLGTCYHRTLLSDSHLSSNKNPRENAIEKFKHDFYSRIWFTYRREFPRLAGSQYKTDCGWGCMLRTGQMMLAEALLCHYVGRSWRWCGAQSDKADMIHRMIIKWFGDDPNPRCSPFSLHQLVKYGAILGKKPGDWYGPSSVSHMLKNSLNNAKYDNPILDSICIYVAQDCTVFIDEIFEMCTANRKTSYSERRDSVLNSTPKSRRNSVLSSKSRRDSLLSSISKSRRDSVLSSTAKSLVNCGSEMLTEHQFEDVVGPSSSARHSLSHRASSTFSVLNTVEESHHGYQSLPFDFDQNEEVCDSSKWRGVVILIPVRLGGDKFNPIYASCVKAMFTHSTCLGIIGGKPRHSLYFVGTQEDKLIYLDPHFCQETEDVKQTNFSLQSFHCQSPRKLPINRMDPSCTLGFYCHTKKDFLELVNCVRDFVVPTPNQSEYPLFVFAEKRTLTTDCDYNSTEQYLRVRHRFVNQQGLIENEVEAEDFVVI